jgi:hypothetical protein
MTLDGASRPSANCSSSSNLLFFSQMHPFKVQIRESKDGQHYAVLVGLNGEDVFVQETRKNEGAIRELVERWFPGVEINGIAAYHLSFWYMCDNHVFIKLKGKTMAAITEEAVEIASKNPHGLLSSAIVVDENDREIRRIGFSILADGTTLKPDELSKWQEAIVSDPDFSGLMAKRS